MMPTIDSMENVSVRQCWELSTVAKHCLTRSFCER
jgi:hypothetical protein